jgi:hypothetical protein
MAKQTVKGSLASRLGQAGQKALQDHKTDDTTYSGIVPLPDGLVAVCQLRDCRFTVVEKEGDFKGKDMFIASGVIVSPEVHNGIPVKGLRTSISEMICDTPKSGGRKTIADHLAHVLNELRKLGATTEELENLEDLEATVLGLKEAAPYFRMHTWKGKPTKEYPEPRVNEQWDGVCDYVPDDSDDGVDDDSGTAEPAAEPEPEQEAPATPVKGKGAPIKGKTTSNPSNSSPNAPKAPVKGKRPTPEPEAPAQTEPDLDALAEAADGNDEDAQRELQAIANAAGIDDETLADETLTWARVVQMIRGEESATEAEPTAEAEDLAALGEAAENGDGEAQARLLELGTEAGYDEDAMNEMTWPALAEAIGEASAPAEAEWTPAVKENYLFKPVGAKKALEYEVMAVNTAKRTVDLKNLDDGKVVKGISWDKLEQ